MSLLCRALSRVILRLHLHRECSGEGEGNKLKHTPPAPQEAMCEICIQSFINLFICYAWVILVCKVLCCVSFEKGGGNCDLCSINHSPALWLSRYHTCV